MHIVYNRYKVKKKYIYIYVYIYIYIYIYNNPGPWLETLLINKNNARVRLSYKMKLFKLPGGLTPSGARTRLGERIIMHHHASKHRQTTSRANTSKNNQARNKHETNTEPVRNITTPSQRRNKIKPKGRNGMVFGLKLFYGYKNVSSNPSTSTLKHTKYRIQIRDSI